MPVRSGAISTILTAGPPFDPSSFGSSLIAWYKADKDVYQDLSATTPSTNGTIADLWKDQSGNNFHLYGSGHVGLGTSPTLNSTGLNGQPALDFVSASQQWVVNRPGDIGGIPGFAWQSANPNFGFFIAFSVRAPFYTRNGYLSSFSDAGNDANAPDGIVYAFLAGDTVSAALIEPIYDSNVYGGTSLSAGNYSWSLTSDGTNLAGYLGNVSQFSNVIAVTLGQTGSAFGVGNSRWTHDTTTNLDGTVAEVVIVQKTITSGDRANMQTYFSTTRGYGV